MKPNLILLHGALGSRAQLQPLKQILSNDFDVHPMDFEGHGIHSLPNRAFRIEHFAENLMHFIDQHNLAPANVFGYSMGGFVALQTAAHQPNIVNRIFTLATKFDWNSESAAREAGMLNPDHTEQKFPDYAASLKQRHSADWKVVMQRTAEMMVHLGVTNPLSGGAFDGLAHRVRFTVGDRDKMVSIEETVAQYRRLKNAELQIFPRTQHPIERVDDGALASAIKDFMTAR
jgi:pimeloyl-ACP methyl ester carboxylesterase